MDLRKSLSPHFNLEEFVVSQTASRGGIDNTPSPVVVSNLTTLCTTILEPARIALGGLHISSGYRCAALNKAVGGSPTSHHMQGFAADVLPLKVSKLDFARWVAKNCRWDQVILEFGAIEGDPSWIHVSCAPTMRRQILRINSRGCYAVRL